jgi:hypothetical protein
MFIGTSFDWSDSGTIALAVLLAFLSGYALTLLPLLMAGIRFRSAILTALAADTVSIAVMEIVDNGVMLAIPNAMAVGIADGLFWGSLALSLLIAGAIAYPVNRWMIARDLGHALLHNHHRHG